jgi:translation initiation factor IF-2
LKYIEQVKALDCYRDIKTSFVPSKNKINFIIGTLSSGQEFLISNFSKKDDRMVLKLKLNEVIKRIELGEDIIVKLKFSWERS